MVEWKSEWDTLRCKRNRWMMCAFMLFVWSCQWQNESWYALWGGRIRTLRYSCPLKSRLGVFSRLLSSPPFVSPLCISFYLIYPLPSSFDSSLYISPNILSFAILSIHLSQFLVSLRHHSTPHLLSSVISYFDSCMYIWSTLNSSLLDFSHLLFCCLISYLISCL